jgi:hypothetical protein
VTQLRRLDGRIPSTIFFTQRVEQPLHHPLDFRSVDVHAALLDAALRATRLISDLRQAGKLFPARSLFGAVVGATASDTARVGVVDRLLKAAPSEPPRLRAILGAIVEQLGVPASQLFTANSLESSLRV